MALRVPLPIPPVVLGAVRAHEVIQLFIGHLQGRTAETANGGNRTHRAILAAKVAGFGVSEKWPGNLTREN